MAVPANSSSDSRESILSTKRRDRLAVAQPMSSGMKTRKVRLEANESQEIGIIDEARSSSKFIGRLKLEKGDGSVERKKRIT